MTDLEKKILRDTEKSGFLSELQVLSIFNKREWVTGHSVLYEDSDESKDRELDVVAVKHFTNKGRKIRVYLYFCIEVKKASQPWIILSIPKRKVYRENHLLYKGTNDGVQNDAGGFKFFTTFISDIDPEKNHPRKTELRFGKSFHEYQKEPGEKSQIYKALMTAIKSTVYYFNQVKVEEQKYNPKEPSFLFIYIPLIVLNGRLFEIFLNEKENTNEIEERKHITLEIPYKNHLKVEKHNNYHNFYPEIVTLDEIDNYLTSIEKMGAEIVKDVEKLIGTKYTK